VTTHTADPKTHTTFKPEPSDPLLGLQAAASIVGISADTLRRQADRGTIPSIRIPWSQHRKFLRSDVLALREKLLSGGGL
jgi:hypothetical protein